LAKLFPKSYHRFQDFLSNFILTEEAFAVYEKKLEEQSSKSASSSSIFGDVLFFSGSIAAVAGTILYLSERTRWVLFLFYVLFGPVNI
jgi:predicted branched-subunit amino acid permease